MPYEPYVELAERLNAAAPIDGPQEAAFFNCGAEGVENAIKIARAATGRQAIVAFEGAYHGRTLMTLSLTSKTSLQDGLRPVRARDLPRAIPVRLPHGA